MKSTRVPLVSSVKCLQINEIRPGMAHSDCSAGRKPFGRIGFRRTIRTCRSLRTEGILGAYGTIRISRSLDPCHPTKK